MKKLAIVLFAFHAIKGYAQYPKIEIPGSEVRKLTSKIVTSQEYELHILLPANYRNITKKYPVLYLMDSQWDFPLVKSIYGQQYYDGFIPDRNYSTIHIQSKVLENTGHSGTKSETFNRGVQYVFERPSLKPDATVLNKYTGTYEGNNEFLNLHFKSSNGKVEGFELECYGNSQFIKKAN